MLLTIPAMEKGGKIKIIGQAVLRGELSLYMAKQNESECDVKPLGQEYNT